MVANHGCRPSFVYAGSKLQFKKKTHLPLSVSLSEADLRLFLSNFIAGDPISPVAEKPIRQNDDNLNVI